MAEVSTTTTIINAIFNNLPATLAAIASIFAVWQARKATTAAVDSKKAVEVGSEAAVIANAEIVNKQDAIHTLVDGNLTIVRAELKSANDRFATLQSVVVELQDALKAQSKPPVMFEIPKALEDIFTTPQSVVVEPKAQSRKRRKG